MRHVGELDACPTPPQETWRPKVSRSSRSVSSARDKDASVDLSAAAETPHPHDFTCVYFPAISMLERVRMGLTPCEAARRSSSRPANGSLTLTLLHMKHIQYGTMVQVC